MFTSPFFFALHSNRRNAPCSLATLGAGATRGSTHICPAQSNPLRLNNAHSLRYRFGLRRLALNPLGNFKETARSLLTIIASTPPRKVRLVKGGCARDFRDCVSPITS